MKAVRWLLFALGAFVVVGVIGNLISGRPALPPASIDVLVVRDVDQLRFTNDSDAALHNCRVQIDGFDAVLRELPARGRAELGRLRFSDPMPQDEFLKRSRTMGMTCYDDANTLVGVRLK